MKLKSCILDGDFKAAGLSITGLSHDEIKDELITIAFDTEAMEVYFFVLSLISRNETALNHYMASEILTTALCHLTGAYYAAFYHAKRASVLEPNNISYLEHLLLYYNIPEQIMNCEEAKVIANKIIELDSKNRTALELLDNIKQ